MELPMSMSLDQLTQHRKKEAVLGWPAASAPPPPPPPHGRNKYVAAANRRLSDTAFAGRSFTLDDDGLVEFQCSARLGVRSEGSSGMDDRDKRIYNSLGDTSGPKGKMTLSELDLDRACQKRGIMFKSGPNPSWCTRWKKRIFILKGNFLYYLATDKKLRDAPVLGAIYLKHSIVEKITLPFARRVLSITPPVPRRKGWKNDESCIFYIRFRTPEGRDEWFEELQQVSFDFKFPPKQDPTITNSLKIKHEMPSSKPKDKSRKSRRDSTY